MVISAFISVLHTAVHFAVAVAIGFPIPFSYLTLNMVWIVLIVVGFWTYMGPACRASAQVHHMLKLHAITIYAASSLAVVYPLFYYAFLVAREYASAQLLLTFALPVIKLLEKRLIYHVTLHTPDLQPAAITFNVEVFNALFVSSCMRNASTVAVTVALMVADFVGACTALYGLRNLMLRIDKLNAKMGPEITRAHMVDVAALIAAHHHADCLSTEDDHVDNDADDHAQRHNKGTTAVVPWVAADEDVNQNGIDAGGDAPTAAIGPPGSPSKTAWKKSLSKQNAVAPDGIALPAMALRGPSHVEVKDPSAISVQMIEQLSLSERQHFVLETRRVLRRVEFLLLVEYTEVIVPLIYFYYLPNRQYFPYLRAMSVDELSSAVHSVLIYGSLQLLSFMLLLLVLTTRFQLAPGALLRFVLQSEWKTVQGQFILWIIYVLQSSLDHVGA
ncbi:hypothetical protein BBJ28_00023472 [Nothophytophthora sp. Chile5]|nr:hypothetical protein BBJ28_00023472 [Nothophytophthora sp. Chile5]